MLLAATDSGASWTPVIFIGFIILLVIGGARTLWENRSTKKNQDEARLHDALNAADERRREEARKLADGE